MWLMEDGSPIKTTSQNLYILRCRRRSGNTDYLTMPPRLFLALCSLTFLSALTVDAVPVNDDHHNAIALGETTNFQTTGSLDGATLEAFESGDGGSAWWTWTPGATKTAHLLLDRSPGSVRLDVFRKSPGGSLLKIPYLVELPLGKHVGFQWAATEEETYYLSVRANADEIPIKLLGFLATPPANDLFESSEQINGWPTSFTGDLRHATRSESDSGTPAQASVWYSWTARANGLASLQCNVGSLTIGVYLSQGPSRTQVAASTDKVYWSAKAGTTYYFSVTGHARQFSMSLERLRLARNYEFAESEVLDSPLPLTVAGHHFGQTSPTDSVWYRWRAPESMWVTVDATSSPSPSLVEVLTGRNPASLATVVPLSNTSEEFFVTRGKFYYVTVQGQSDQGGFFELTLSPTPVAPNDDFEDRIVVNEFSAVWTGDLRFATAEEGEPPIRGETPARTLWWEYTPTEGGNMEFEWGRRGSSDLRVFTRLGAEEPTKLSDLSAFPRFTTPDIGRTSTFRVSPGITYYLQVDSATGSSFELEVRPPNYQPPPDPPEERPENRPPNDDFADRIALPSQSNFRVAMDMRNATKETEDWGFHPGAWWSWQPPHSGYYLFSTAQRGAGGSLAISTRMPPWREDNLRTPAWFYADQERTYNIHLSASSRDDSDPFDRSLAGFTVRAAPPLLNDSFTTPLVLDDSLTGHNIGATSEDTEGEHAGAEATHSVWYEWTAPRTRYYKVRTVGAAMRIGVYEGDQLGELTSLNSGTSSVGIDAIAGQRYRIALDQDAYEEFTLRVSSSLRPSNEPPPNDDFDHAAILTGTFASVSGTLRGSSLQDGEPKHSNYPNTGSVWWRWTPSQSGTFSIDTPGDSNILAVYEGESLETLQEIASGRDVHFLAESEVTYAIAVAFDSLDSFTLQIDQSVASPSNDHFASASLIYADQSVEGRFAGSSIESGEPTRCFNLYNRSLWYRWECPKTGPYRLTETGVGCMGVYTGNSLAELNLVARHSSKVRWRGEAGQIYYLAMSSLGTRDFEFLLEQLPRPFNDEFSDRLRLGSVSGVALPGNTTNATREPGERNHGGDSSPGGSLWWSWTSRTTGTVSIDLRHNQYTTPLAVYTGETLDSLSLVHEGFQRTQKFTAQAGQTYQIAIAAPSKTSVGPFHFTIHSSPPANDQFQNRTVLASELPITGSTHTFNASTELGEILSADNSVWWEWTAPRTEWVDFDTHSSDVPTSGRILTGTYLPFLDTVVTANGSFLAESGTTYYIALSGKDGRSSFTLSSSAPPASNDDFENALLLTGESVSPSYRSWGATTQPGEPEYLKHSLWWEWTAPRDGWVTGTPHLFIGDSLESLQAISPMNESVPAKYLVDEGQRYWIAVSSAGPLSSRFQLSMNPPGDLFAAPIDLFSGEFTITEGTIEGTTWEDREPHHNDQVPSLSMWFRWVAPYSGPFRFLIHSTLVSLEVYTGNDLASLTPVAKRFYETWQLREGVEYRIVINGRSTKHTSFRLYVEPLSGHYHEWSYGRVWRDDPDHFPDQDPDRDGRSNLMEMALCSNPLRADSEELSISSQVQEDGIVFSIIRPKHIDGLRYSFDVSSNLEDWVNSQTIPHETWTTPLNDSQERFSVKLPGFTPETDPKLFARLRVELSSLGEGDE